MVSASLASYATRRVGLKPHEVLDSAAARAQPQVAEILEQAVTKETDLTGDWGSAR